MRNQSSRLWLCFIVCLTLIFPVALIAAQDSTPDPSNFALTATALSGGMSTESPFAATATALAGSAAQATLTPLVPVETVEAPEPTTAPAAETEVTIEAAVTGVETATEESTAEIEAASATPDVVETRPTARPTSQPALTTPEQATAEGTSTLILLIGLGAVLAVGGLALLRERYQDKNSPNGE